LKINIFVIKRTLCRRDINRALYREYLDKRGSLESWNCFGGQYENLCSRYRAVICWLLSSAMRYTWDSLNMVTHIRFANNEE